MDVDDCFHRLRIGQSLPVWFSREHVRARDVSLSGREVSVQMSGFIRALVRSPLDSDGPCTLHNQSMNMLCMQWREHKTSRS